MTLHAAAVLTILGLVAVVTLVGTVGRSLEYRQEESALWFIASGCVAAVWTVSATLGLHTTSSSVWELLDLVAWVAICTLPVTWLAFVLVYTGRRHRTRPMYLLAMGAIPAVTIGVVLTEQVVGGDLVRTNLDLVELHGRALPVVSLGSLGLIQIGYSFFLLALAALLLLEQLFSSHGIYHRQAALLAVATAVPVAVGVTRPVGIEVLEGASLTSFSFAVTGIAAFVALERYDILQTRPVPLYLAHSTILKSIDTPLVVSNESHVIVHSNVPAERLLGEGDSLLGQPCTTLPGVAESAGGSIQTTDLVEIDSDDGHHVYLIRRTALLDDHDRRHGSVIWYQDMTEIRRRERRLNVLNRVLRHDIRNEMNVILGHAQTGQTEGAAIEETLAAIEATATSVVDLSETARTIERLITLAPTLEPAGSIDDAIEEIEGRIETDESAATLDAVVNIDGDTTVPAGYDDIVWQLVENGIRHSDEPAPTVAIRVDGHDGQIATSVTDDGPGIPPSELAVFDAGEETSLDHASGLGLWMVHWVVAEFGGEVHVDSTDDGTTVTVMLPVAESAEDQG